MLIAFRYLEPDEAMRISSAERIAILDFAHRTGVEIKFDVKRILLTRPDIEPVTQQSHFGNDAMTRHVSEQTDDIISRFEASFPGLMSANLSYDDLDNIAEAAAGMVADVYGIEVPFFEWGPMNSSTSDENTLALAQLPFAGETGMITLNEDKKDYYAEHPDELLNSIAHEMTHIYQKTLSLTIDRYIRGSTESQLATMFQEEVKFWSAERGQYSELYSTLWSESHAFFVGERVGSAFRALAPLPEEETTPSAAGTEEGGAAAAPPAEAGETGDDDAAPAPSQGAKTNGDD